MRKNNTIRFRVDSELKNRMLKAIEKYNAASVGELNEASFIRMAIKVLSNKILTAKKVSLAME